MLLRESPDRFKEMNYCIIKMKCCHCSLELDESCFYSSKIKNRNYICKECCKKQRRERYKNKDKKKVKNNTQSKICNNCKENKLLDEFYKKDKYSHKHICKKCQSKINKLPKIKKQRNIQRKKRLKENPQLRVKNALCVRIWGLVKQEWKSKIFYKYLDISYPKFLKWIHFQFNSEMNMENYGSYWHIDHTKPCKNFDLDDDNQLKECFNWKNLRPLKKIENLRKSSKLLPFEILKQEIKAHYFNKHF